jgi:hypothetical protein
MNRVYKDIESKSDVKYFIGDEIEDTTRHGLKTLFLVGNLHSDYALLDKIIDEHKIKHFYIGANQSLTVNTMSYTWTEFISDIVLSFGKKVVFTVDVEPQVYYWLYNSLSKEIFDQLHFNISFKLPSIVDPSKINIKIDDIGFNETNQGVWVAPLQNLTFTTWDEYKNDEVI